MNQSKQTDESQTSLSTPNTLLELCAVLADNAAKFTDVNIEVLLSVARHCVQEFVFNVAL